MEDLKGKVALVTGAARGIGAGIARAFIDTGSQVAIADVLDDEGKALAAILGPRAMYCHLDVADESEWKARILSAMTPSPAENPIVADIVANPAIPRVGLPADVADAVLFLASAQSRYITECELPVDGGFINCRRIPFDA